MICIYTLFFEFDFSTWTNFKTQSIAVSNVSLDCLEYRGSDWSCRKQNYQKMIGKKGQLIAERSGNNKCIKIAMCCSVPEQSKLMSIIVYKRGTKLSGVFSWCRTWRNVAPDEFIY